VAEKSTRERKAAIRKHNDKTHVRSLKFEVGNYVLVAEQRKSGVSKLQSSGRARAASRVWSPTTCST
jgi:hypothetical protein